MDSTFRYYLRHLACMGQASRLLRLKTMVNNALTIWTSAQQSLVPFLRGFQ